MLIVPLALAFLAVNAMSSKSQDGPVPAGDDWLRPVPGRITSKFGPRVHPVTGEVGKMHNGVDLSGSTGTKIISPADGIVSGRNYNDIGGNQLMIVHTNGLQTGYSHLSKYYVNIGDRITKGQAIAEVGATGRVTGPHLHFSMKDKQKNFIDPMKYIPA